MSLFDGGTARRGTPRRRATSPAFFCPHLEPETTELLAAPADLLCRIPVGGLCVCRLSKEPRRSFLVSDRCPTFEFTLYAIEQNLMAD